MSLRDHINSALATKFDSPRKCKLGEYADSLDADDLSAFNEMMENPRVSTLTATNILNGVFRISHYTVRSHRLGICKCHN